MTEESIRERIAILRGQHAALVERRNRLAQESAEVSANILRHEGAIVEMEALLKTEDAVAETGGEP